MSFDYYYYANYLTETYRTEKSPKARIGANSNRMALGRFERE